LRRKHLAQHGANHGQREADPQSGEYLGKRCGHYDAPDHRDPTHFQNPTSLEKNRSDIAHGVNGEQRNGYEAMNGAKGYLRRHPQAKSQQQDRIQRHLRD